MAICDVAVGQMGRLHQGPAPIQNFPPKFISSRGEKLVVVDQTVVFNESATDGCERRKMNLVFAQAICDAEARSPARS